MCSFYSYGQPESVWQIRNGEVIRWVYSFGDEFDGTSLDETKWLNSYPWGRNANGPNDHAEYMTDGQNISFGYSSMANSGTLRLTAKNNEGVYARGIPYDTCNTCPLSDGSPNLQWWGYTSGMIFSKQRFKYGLFEIRFKVPFGTGLFPAFWLYGDNPNEEFDIFESKGERPAQLHWDVHCPGDDCDHTVGDWETFSGNFIGGFNTVRGEWSPGALSWFCNGHQFSSWTGELNYQAHLIANLNLNGNNGPFPPAIDATTPYPSTFEIDYIRVFSKIDCQQTINICNYDQVLTSQPVMTGYQITLGGASCSGAILESTENLDMIATNNIRLLPGADMRGAFSAKIVNCPPGPQSIAGLSDGQFPENSANRGDVSFTENLNISADSSNTDDKAIMGPVEQREASFYTKIYPNPTQGRINIEFEGSIFGEVEIQLINSMEQIVFTKSGIKENFHIDIAHLPKGIYYLVGNFGENSISEKIILE